MTDPDITDPHATPPAESATAPPAAGEKPEQDAESSWMLRRHLDPSLNPDDPLDETVSAHAGEDPRARIEWVRPTDLFARVSARASERTSGRVRTPAPLSPTLAQPVRGLATRSPRV